MLRPGPVRLDSPSWRLVSFLLLLAGASLAGPERLLAAENTLPRLVKFQGQLPLADAASLPRLPKIPRKPRGPSIRRVSRVPKGLRGRRAADPIMGL
jgi:hypothetical protein